MLKDDYRVQTIYCFVMQYTQDFFFRLFGIKVSFTTTIKKRVKISGQVKIGQNVFIDEDVRISGRVNIGNGSHLCRGTELIGNIDIGDYTIIGSYSTISTLTNSYLKIGNDVLINNFSVLGASDFVEIRDHCIFAPYVQITDASHNFENPADYIKHSGINTAPVLIEENVWLGSGVMVMKGVTIGMGSVIGAKSLVTKDIPQLSIAYGIPAEVKRIRGSKSE